MKIKSTLDTSLTLILLFIYTSNNVNVVANPVPPTLVFPEDVKFPDEDRDNVRKCLEEDYSMPYYNKTNGQVIFQICFQIIFIPNKLMKCSE